MTISCERFFEGFVMAVCAAGIGMIDTRRDAQHHRFQPVADWLQREYGDEYVMVYLGHPVTGRFVDLDEALLHLEGIYTHHELGNRIVVFDVGSVMADRYLDEHFTTEEAALLREAAVHWITGNAVHRSSAEKVR